jgi:hypothetical protein
LACCASAAAAAAFGRLLTLLLYMACHGWCRPTGMHCIGFLEVAALPVLLLQCESRTPSAAESALRAH